jgi:hypothetical protein
VNVSSVSGPVRDRQQRGRSGHAMKLQALVPTVEHTEETDLGTKMPRVASNLKQRLGAGVKEQVVDQPLVLQRERRQFPR